MRKRFTRILAALALLVFMAPSMVGWGQTRTTATIAAWNNRSLTANTAYKADNGDSNNKNVAKLTSSINFPTSGGDYAYYQGNLSSYPEIVFSDLTLTNYSDITLTFYSRGSKKSNITVTYSTSASGSFSDLTTTSNVTGNVAQYTVSNIPSNAVRIKLKYNANSGSFYFGTPVFSGTAPFITLSPTTISVDSEEHISGYGEDEALSMTTNISGTDPTKYEVFYCSTSNGTFSTDNPDWMYASVAYRNSHYYVDWYIEENTTPTNRDPYYFKIYHEDSDTYSDVITVSQTGVPTKVETPTFDPVGGTFNTAQSVTLNCTTPNAAIYYTIDGTTPSATNGTLYESAIAVNGTQTIKAIGIKTGLDNSDVAFEEYIIKVLAPTVTVSGGTYYENKSVELACETAGATIRYTLDGAEPTASSTEYSSAITIDHNCTLKAKAFKTNWTTSEEVSATYVIKMVAPSFEVAGGTYDATQTVPMSATNGASIYYTTDGTTPSSSNGTMYESAITVESTTTIKAIAVKANCTDSEIAEATYTLKANSPSFDQTAGTYTGAQTITITNITTGSSIKYKTTENGEWIDYPTNGINLVSTTTIWAKAQKTNLEDSEIVSATYVIKYPIVVYQSTGGTISASQSLEEAGKTITLTASANIGYTFGAWDVKDGQNQAVTVSENSFTMPASNVSVRATFNTDANVHTVSFSINGTINMTATVASGAIDLSKFKANVTTEGYELKGWSETEGGSIIANNSYTPSEDKTLYAVFGEVSTYELVSSISEGTYLIGALGSSIGNNQYTPTALKFATNNISSGKWNVHSSSALSFNDNTVVGIPNGACEFVLTGNNTDGFTVSEGNNYVGCSDYTNNNKLAKGSTYSSTLWTFAVKNDNNDCNFYLKTTNSSNQKYYIYDNGTSGTEIIRGYKEEQSSGRGLYFFKKVASSGGNATVVATPKLTGIPANVVVKVVNNGVVTFTGTNNNASNLIVEDGSQLIASSAVQATVQKNITGYGNENTVKTGWNFIASPINVNNLAPTAVPNMLSNTYDLYQLDPSTEMWQNYKAHEGNAAANFNLANGRGYLYANSDNVTLSFAGTIKPFTTTNNANQVELAPGWNLVGNPYTFNVYSSKSYYTITTVNNENVVTAVESAASVITPCTGIVVKNTGTETDHVAFLESAGEWATGNQGNIQMVLAQQTTNRGNASTLDNAIVSFNEGSQLPKFYFGEQNANLYIPQDNEEYAIVSSNAQGEMPVNFKASQDGQYTITVNSEGVEVGYLHLIDNIAGKDTDLLATPSYTFNAKADDYESRFRLVFSTTMVNAEMGEDFAFISNGQLVIANVGEAILQVIDVTGRVVAIENINGTCSKAISAKAGVYVLRLINGTDVKTQKMVIR